MKLREKWYATTPEEKINIMMRVTVALCFGIVVVAAFL